MMPFSDEEIYGAVKHNLPKTSESLTAILSLSILLGLSACSSEPKNHYKGADLLEAHCASCHNLAMPPKTYENEKAPPMMAVAFHVKDFMPVKTPSDKKPKFIAFFQDYPLHPSKEKSFCDKESLKSYGLMPSLKGKVTKDELGAIAEYVYDYYDQDKFLQQMQQKAKFDALPEGEKLAMHNGCLNCHDKLKAKVAPSFRAIAQKKNSEIKSIIKKGSKGKWKGFEKSFMPAYKKLSDAEIETLVKWIKTL